jgi:biopolymer transport protein ExbB
MASEANHVFKHIEKPKLCKKEERSMGSMITGLSGFFNAGGIWMYAILGVQIASVAIIIERVFALYITRQPNQKKLAKTFESDIKKGQLDRVISKASSMGTNSPIAVIAYTGAQAAHDMGGREEIQFKMDEVLLEETSRLEKRTGFLAMLGNVSTLLGLIGTVVGLIEAFTAMGTIDPAQKSAYLAAGISQAMHATAYGLITAVPALIMYAVLQNRSNVLTEDLNKAALKLFIWLGFSFESIPHKKAK